MSTPGPTILLVEDNPITRKMIRYTLETEGFDVVDAGDGAAALEAVSTRRPDLLIVDSMLPDIDGARLVAEVRRRMAAPALPAIVVTGMVSRLEEFRGQGDAATQFLAKPVEPSRLLEVVRAQLSGPPRAAAGVRVLVVDDELLNRKLASFRLKQAGYEVDLAASGAEALERSRRQPPDAIVTDVMMPGMDGFTLCREARRDPRLARIPIVLVSSAYAEEADRDLARKMGANALVLRTPDLGNATAALEESLHGAAAASVAASDPTLAALHRERVQVQLERQAARNETLLRQAAIQATALSIIRGLSEVLAQPRDVTQVLGDVLVHSLDAAGLSTGLLYVKEPDGRNRLQAQFGLPASVRRDAEAGFGQTELLERIVEARRPAALTDASGDAATRDLLHRLGHRSALVVPFVVLGETFGALVLASDSQDLSESAWIAFARSVALQFGQTVALGQSLKRLAESQERSRALMEGANDAIFVLSLEGEILEANQHAEGLLALPREGIVGQYISHFSPPSGFESSDNVHWFREIVAAGGGRNENVFLRRGDGALVEVDFSLSINDIGGRAYVLSIGRDVTERNRAAAALRATERRLHHLVSSSPAVLYSMRVEGEALLPTWVSENIVRLSGYPSAEVIDERWWGDRVHPDDRQAVAAQVSRLLSESYLAREYRFRHKDGHYLWVSDEQILVRDENGHAEVVGSWTDITARKQAEGRVVESEEKYRLLFDSNPHPMWVFDQETLAFVAVNDAALRHYGYSRDQWLAMSALDIRPAEEAEAFKQEYEWQTAQGTLRNYRSGRVFKHRKSDGTLIEVEVAANATVFEGRGAWLVLATDVTEKRSLEAQLLQSQKMESIGRLAGGIAHDFNNLLGVMTGYGELLRKRLTDPRLHKYADDIVKAAERAAGLTRQLLAFSRKQVLQPTILDLNSVVGDMESMLRRLIGEDVQLVTIFDGTLAAVRADRGQMEQVLMNLAVNARDAMPKGGRLTIETGNVDLDAAYARLHPGVVPGLHTMVAMSDSGHGMSAEVKARIFEPFFTTKEAGKGTGLGLATVHGIVTQSGGHVWVYSEPGQGTTFKIYFPWADAAAGTGEPAAAETEVAGGSETILVVEDEESLRELIRECLQSSGYSVLEARQGTDALRICDQHPTPIDLLITDVVMPGLSGAELASRVTMVRAHIRVLYMSGYTDDAVVLHGVLSADLAFLQKPFSQTGLLRKVREVLDQPPA